MIESLIQYFVPRNNSFSVEENRRIRLIISIILITALFDLNYSLVTVMIDMKRGTVAMLIALCAHSILPFFVRKNSSYLLITNVYVFFGVFAVVVCIYNSGGLFSPVLPWLATSPVVALLMAGRTTGIIWATTNGLIAILFAQLNSYGYSLVSYDTKWRDFLFTNCGTGLVLIIFVVALVFENEKSKAFKKLADQNELLAEEKKKNALLNIAKDIHDNVGQTLALSKLYLDRVQEDNINEESNGIINNTIKLVSQAINDLRQMSKELNVNNASPMNFPKELENELNLVQTVSALDTQFNVIGRSVAINSTVSLVLFRVSQEVLNNIIKHSEASEIQVTLIFTSKSLSLIFSDNGIGMSYEKLLNRGHGLHNIQTRVKDIGGSCDIKSNKNSGTKLSFEVPL